MGNTAQIAAHALLESVSVMLHKDLLTCVREPPIFLYNLMDQMLPPPVADEGSI